MFRRAQNRRLFVERVQRQRTQAQESCSTVTVLCSERRSAWVGRVESVGLISPRRVSLRALGKRPFFQHSARPMNRILAHHFTSPFSSNESRYFHSGHHERHCVSYSLFEYDLVSGLRFQFLTLLRYNYPQQRRHKPSFDRGIRRLPAGPFHG